MTTVTVVDEQAVKQQEYSELPVLPLVDENHPLLSQELEEFDFANPPEDPMKIAHQLAKAMITYGGIGISANQLGLPYRVFAMGTNPIAVCFNPRIVDQGNEEIVLDEGCLSYPGLAVKVKRVKNIKVRYTLPTGDIETQKFTGMTARVFLHELDHMNGVNFINRAGPMAKSMALKKWTKLKRMRNLKKKLGYKA